MRLRFTPKTHINHGASLSNPGVDILGLRLAEGPGRLPVADRLIPLVFLCSGVHKQPPSHTEETTGFDIWAWIEAHWDVSHLSEKLTNMLWVFQTPGQMDPGGGKDACVCVLTTCHDLGKDT